MLRGLWQYIKEHRSLLKLISVLYNCIMFNKINIRNGNHYKNQGAFLKKCKIKIKGVNNTVIFEEGVRLQNCVIHMSGNNSRLHIQKNSYVENQTFHFEDEGCEISVGKKCVFSGGEFAVAEDGCKITIGDKCLFSRNIHIVTTDSHSILDIETRERINCGQDVEVGNRVWLTAGVTLLKGSKVANGCVVGRSAVVTKRFDKENCVIVGCPGKVMKENVEWKAERI